MALTRKQKAIKNKWLKALRSGKYSQTQRILFRPEADGDIPAGYCCLGVLQHVVDGGVSCYDLPDGGKESKSMPQIEWYEKYGIRTIMMRKEITVGESTASLEGTLGTLNDRGATFKELADIIEEHMV